MPYYDYKCKKCGTVVELEHSIHDTEKKVCAKCGYALQRLIGTTSFVLNGTGWARDGYK